MKNAIEKRPQAEQLSLNFFSNPSHENRSVAQIIQMGSFPSKSVQQKNKDYVIEKIIGHSKKLDW